MKRFRLFEMIAGWAFVLPGTSRKRVFKICNIHHIKIVEKKIALFERWNIGSIASEIPEGAAALFVVL